MAPGVPRDRRRTLAVTPLALALGALASMAGGVARADAPAYEVPTTGLVHDAVASGRRGAPIPIIVTVQNALAFESLVLVFRPEGEPDYRRREMKRVGDGTYRAEIPSSDTVAPAVAYYIEAVDKDGAPVAGRGSAGSPLVIPLEGPPPRLRLPVEPTDEDEEDAMPSRRLYLAVLVGSGAGWAAGAGDTNADTRLDPSGFAFAQLGHLAPEVGYWVAPGVMLSVQGRLQSVVGTNDVHGPDGRVHRSANSAFAAFAKATWFADGRKGFRPFFSLAAGGGYIRHVVTFASLNDCGPAANETCVDTIKAGPVAAGPGAGVIAELSPTFAAVLQANTQLTFPAFTLNLDLNLGAALRF
jgi:hypothetical protein